MLTGIKDRRIAANFMRVWLAAGNIFLSALFCAAQDEASRTGGEIHAHLHSANAKIRFLEDPQRDEYQKPQEVMKALDLKKGEVIADVGAGSGYFAFRLAQHVEEGGRIYAVDVNPDTIRHMNRRIRDMGAKNLVTILADPDDPLLPFNSVDRFFLCNTWHHIERQTEYLALMKRMLKPAGQVVMIDFHKKPLPAGPPVGMKIAREDLICQMEDNGFRLMREHNFLPFQYFLVFVGRD